MSYNSVSLLKDVIIWIICLLQRIVTAPVHPFMCSFFKENGASFRRFFLFLWELQTPKCLMRRDGIIQYNKIRQKVTDKKRNPSSYMMYIYTSQNFFTLNFMNNKVCTTYLTATLLTKPLDFVSNGLNFDSN